MTSSSKLSREIFTHCADESSGADVSSNNRARSTIRGVSVASQFKTSLQSLVSDLENTEPHYIRCIKPNLKKAGNNFDAGEALRQLRYAGMMEAIRIRREGYALREPHESFYNKFHILLDSEDLRQGEGIEHLVKVLSKRLSVTDVDWQIGHSKIFLRRELASKLDALTSLRIRSAARIVGRFGRFVAHRRAGHLLTDWARLRLIIIRKQREYRAAAKIQSLHRMMRELKSFETYKSSVTKIQALARMISAREYVQAVRDPYQGMIFHELQELFNAEIECLEAAVATKDYELAAELEKRIDPLKEAMEKKRPITRALIDKLIAETEEQLGEAVAKKDYVSCPPLQQKLDELNKKRKNYPTIDELRQNLKNAQLAVDEAAAQRDYSGAAVRQAAVDEAKNRLENALFVEGKMAEPQEESQGEEEGSEDDIRIIISRSDLETQICTKKNEVDSAIASKDFAHASLCQDELDKLEIHRQDYPTIDELKMTLVAKEDEMASAISRKQFAIAGSLQEEIDSLSASIETEKKIARKDASKECGGNPVTPTAILPDGTQFEISSRAELEKTISEYEHKVQDAAMKKHFSAATMNQDAITELEKLRIQLPTLQEMKELKLSLEAKMAAAMKSKNFAQAGKIHDDVLNLESNIEEEKSKMTHFAKKW
eukprot:scaffold430_cov234-Chaetoceros_neogracile.AAC.9